jgi:hypothetical protein
MLARIAAHTFGRNLPFIRLGAPQPDPRPSAIGIDEFRRRGLERAADIVLPVRAYDPTPFAGHWNPKLFSVAASVAAALGHHRSRR